MKHYGEDDGRARWEYAAFEKRVAEGHLYTFKGFVEHYGEANGRRLWQEAAEVGTTS